VIVELPEVIRDELFVHLRDASGSITSSGFIPPSHLYARVIERTTAAVRVTVDPFESQSSVFPVSPNKVWPIPAFCDSLLGNVRSYYKLVHDPFQVCVHFSKNNNLLLFYFFPLL
jgi:hypothetical protein